eukprot:XP_011671323.1 PREDICTED: uncharacterized protein LOC105441665 [Strongylocentrotus purpuratus]
MQDKKQQTLCGAHACSAWLGILALAPDRARTRAASLANRRPVHRASAANLHARNKSGQIWIPAIILTDQSDQIGVIGLLVDKYEGVWFLAVPLPTHPRWQFIVSSTPGGTCGHIELEFKSLVFPCRPDLIVVEAGTNNLRQPVEEAEMEFRHLLRIARKTCEVVAISILPRLDGLGYVVPSFNAAFQRSAREEGASWVDLTDRFPVQELRLWAYDGVHLSDCTGMPRLTAAVAEVCSQ